MIFIILSFLFSCIKDKNNQENIKNFYKPFFERVDTIKIEDKYLYLDIFYIKKDKKYFITHNYKKNDIPFLFIVDKDTISDTGFGFNKLKTKKDDFIVYFNKGNKTTNDYYMQIKNNEILLKKILTKYNDKIIDSLVINEKLLLLNVETNQNIIDFLNKD